MLARWARNEDSRCPSRRLETDVMPPYSHYAGGRNAPHKTTDTAPHTTLQLTHHHPRRGLSTTSHAAAQYVIGMDAESRRIICVCDMKRRMKHIMRAWIACGVMDGLRKGVRDLFEGGLVVEGFPEATDVRIGRNPFLRWYIEKADMDKRGGSARTKLGSCERVQ